MGHAGDARSTTRDARTHALRTPWRSRDAGETGQGRTSDTQIVRICCADSTRVIMPLGIARRALGFPAQTDWSAAPPTVRSWPPVMTSCPVASSRPSIVAPDPDARSRSEVRPLATSTWIDPGSGYERGCRPP
jgi:hypothetical protein